MRSIKKRCKISYKGARLMETNNSETKNFETIKCEFDDSEFMNKVRRDMQRFASIQLKDEGLAEDAVQEALIAAHKNRASFGRKSAFKTWVFAILKNKIIDILRKRKREISISELSDENSDDISGALFNERGFWHLEERPLGWSAPMESVKDKHFWRVFETCLSALPENLGRIFMMREFLELESNEICNTLDISTSNLHVILYRARIRLRECLENKWFKQES